MKQVHLIGVLGSGMLSLAKLLVDQGMKVSGEDSQPAPQHMPLWFNQVQFNQLTTNSSIEHADTIIYSTAIPQTHPALKTAIALNKTIIHRSQALDLITGSRQLLCITGTHGKTTCSALMAWIFKSALKAPSYYIGGTPNQFEAAASILDSEHFIIEADESDGSLKHYTPHGAMITNIEPDHLEHHQSSVAIYNQSFATFMQKPQYLVMNADDETSKALMANAPELNIKCIGFSPDGDYQIQSIHHEGHRQYITILDPNQATTMIMTSLQGKHNAYNVSMCWLMAQIYGIPNQQIIDAIASFNGVGRRNTLIGQIKIDQHTIPVIDDYGHHPTECRFVLEEYKRQQKHVIHVFEPHRFSRFNYFYDDFKQAFLLADHTVLLPVYAAGENDHQQLNSSHMQASLNALDQPCMLYTHLDALDAYIKQHIQPNSIIIFQGAGPITQLAKDFVRNSQYATTL